MREIPIRGEMIRLGELLKLAGVVGTGGEAKLLLASEEVRVNGSRKATGRGCGKPYVSSTPSSLRMRRMIATDDA